MTNGEQTAADVMRALAQGDKSAVIRMLREAGAPALKQVLAEVQAQAKAQHASQSGGVQAIKARLEAGKAAGAKTDVQHGIHGHAQATREALRANGRTPTVMMGDTPGGLRWVLLVLGLLALAAWLAFAEL